MIRCLAAALCLAAAPALPAAAAPPSAADPSPYGLATRIAAFVQERAPRPPDRIEIPPLEGFAVEAAADDVEIRLSVNDNQSFVGLVPVAVQLLSAGEELRRGVVTVRVEVSERVPVAARPLRSGHVIGPDDVLLEPRELGSLPSGAVTDPAELVGQRVTRYVDAGRPLLREGIERAPRVERGQQVKLRFRNGPLVIETVGEARQDGVDGDHIRVQNVASRREVVGRIGRDGVVHVEY